MDQARLMCRLSGGFAGRLDVCSMLGEFYRFRSRGALAGSSLGVLVVT